MIDPLSASLGAASAGSPLAPVLTFFAGMLTSVGPCVAPRYVAIAAITGGHRRPMVPTGAFVAGLLAAFMLLGLGAGLMGSVARYSGLLYALLAVSLVAAGIITLVRAAPNTTAHCCATDANPINSQTGRKQSLGGIFLLGAASALVVSPCCTPIIAGIIATSTAIGKPVYGTMLLASFALGHAMPLFFAGSVTTLTHRFIQLGSLRQAPAIISGALMLALGAYYGVLA